MKMAIGLLIVSSEFSLQQVPSLTNHEVLYSETVAWDEEISF